MTLPGDWPRTPSSLRTVNGVTRLEYDGEASAHHLVDVVYEVDDRPAPVARWIDGMRLLNTINDSLARRILARHRDCGSGSGSCDSDEDGVPIAERADWGCETTAVIAHHYGLSYPSARLGSDWRPSGTEHGEPHRMVKNCRLRARFHAGSDHSSGVSTPLASSRSRSLRGSVGCGARGTGQGREWERAGPEVLASSMTTGRATQWATPALRDQPQSNVGSSVLGPGPAGPSPESSGANTYASASRSHCENTGSGASIQP